MVADVIDQRTIESVLPRCTGLCTTFVYETTPQGRDDL